MKFRPLHDRVVVRIEEDMKTAGGIIIIIPDIAQEKPMQAEVVAAGPGGRDESGRIVPLGLKRVTACSSGSGRAPKSRLMVRICSS